MAPRHLASRRGRRRHTKQVWRWCEFTRTHLNSFVFLVLGLQLFEFMTSHHICSCLNVWPRNMWLEIVFAQRRSCTQCQKLLIDSTSCQTKTPFIDIAHSIAKETSKGPPSPVSRLLESRVLVVYHNPKHVMYSSPVASDRSRSQGPRNWKQSQAEMRGCYFLIKLARSKFVYTSS